MYPSILKDQWYTNHPKWTYHWPFQKCRRKYKVLPCTASKELNLEWSHVGAFFYLAANEHLSWALYFTSRPTRIPFDTFFYLAANEDPIWHVLLPRGQRGSHLTLYFTSRPTRNFSFLALSFTSRPTRIPFDTFFYLAANEDPIWHFILPRGPRGFSCDRTWCHVGESIRSGRWERYRQLDSMNVRCQEGSLALFFLTRGQRVSRALSFTSRPTRNFSLGRFLLPRGQRGTSSPGRFLLPRGQRGSPFPGRFLLPRGQRGFPFPGRFLLPRGQRGPPFGIFFFPCGQRASRAFSFTSRPTRVLALYFSLAANERLGRFLLPRGQRGMVFFFFFYGAFFLPRGQRVCRAFSFTSRPTRNFLSRALSFTSRPTRNLWYDSAPIR